MKISTFDDDLLELREFADRLGRFIATERDYVEDGLVLALTSKFGSGKTTFLAMWKASLEGTEDETGRPLLISLNAWESDYYDAPLFALVSALVERLKTKGRSSKADTLKETAKNVGWSLMAAGNQIARKTTGVDVPAAVGHAARKKAEREDPIRVHPDAFSLYEHRKAAMQSLRDAIREIVADSEHGVWFLVDELDRCRPDYAIAYLETIKHIFDIKGAVFLLAADRRQLENSARAAFGPDLDFEEYYRKFVHREITLPPISAAGYRNLALKYVPYYLEREGTRYCRMALDDHRIKNIVELIGALKLTPRQIQEVFRVLGHISATSEENKGRLSWWATAESVAMAALRIGAPRIFDRLGSGRLEPEEALDFLQGLVGGSRGPSVRWWFTLFFTGGGLRVDKGESLGKIMQRVGLIKEASDFSMVELHQWDSSWEDSSNRFGEIQEKIERVSQWG
uniref:KAP family P-loop domain-containing protein n=1 Tax=Candidatus Kentrum sp. DK TaxID=2126562 RepID=A0A450TBF9_9GAMM|nr:MAG: KAP family P-loop domain-containing protein [Candidatus Kentron sp. DK]